MLKATLPVSDQTGIQFRPKIAYMVGLQIFWAEALKFGARRESASFDASATALAAHLEFSARMLATGLLSADTAVTARLGAARARMILTRRAFGSRFLTSHRACHNDSAASCFS
jgi:hypothetical protein